MKRSWGLIVAVILALAGTVPPVAWAGNGAPSGSHYNLNLLGKNKCPGDDMVGSNRHSIFVQLNYTDVNPNDILGDDPGTAVTLNKRNKIFLAPGDSFQVTDGNACNDNDGAAFTLPANVATAWDVYIRELGKPGGTGQLTTCGISDSGTPTDPSDDEVVCSTNSVDLERKPGRSLFRNVTKELTTVEYCVQIIDQFGNVTCEEQTASLFDPDFYQYLWDYDNQGLRLVQMRFYPKQ
jgi:hypothetical protein